ncbi:MAG: acyl-CoA dehydrogenase [Alphaproteobacteria bacterium]|nr:acyl-CoA dehydrogenase [Alphaproteobacteria bacterium]
MSDYRAPLADMRFVLEHEVGLAELMQLEPYRHADGETVDAVLEEAARLAADVVAPLNRVGDQQGSRLENGEVRTPEGFRDAYRQFREGGWNSVPVDPEHGGSGLPWAISLAVQEMFTSANMAFALCPLLTQGAIELLAAHGSAEQKELYLGRLVSGEWTGTMNLTEPQAGSDVGAVKTRAIRQPDGSYRITGSKIFISYGEHDMAENIIHLVLARTPDAPAGTRGISCFIVPKFLVGADGRPGARNDLRAVSLEHKLGIHASPTCVMSFGDNEGAVGYLVGEENSGMRCMFTMMNNARLSVGLQGLAVAERAYQHALAYARERRQGRPIGAAAADAPILFHPDVRRMLLTMKAQIEAMRALIYLNGAAMDRVHGAGDDAARARAQSLVDLLIPVSKGWSTDLGVEITSTAMQVYGGMGYVEETGVAQLFRDARIAPIYEGTNGIQALDLVMRKLPLQGGAPVRAFLDQMRALDAELARGGADLGALRPALAQAVQALGEATGWLQAVQADRPEDAAAGASAYLRMFGIVTGGYLLARAALAAQRALGGRPGDRFLKEKIATAAFYAEQILPQGTALLGPVTAGAGRLREVALETGA